MNSGSGAMGTRVRQVVEVVLGQAGLVDHDHGLGRRSVDEPQRHRSSRRGGRASPGPRRDPVAQRLGLLDQPLAGALQEVGDHAVDGDAPALDHHPGLAGRHETPRRPASTAARRSSSATDILPIAQSVPTVRITCLPGGGDARPRSPSAPGRAGSRRSRAPVAAAAAANSGSSPRNVCSPLRTSSPARARPGSSPASRRELAAGRRDPDQQGVAAGTGERLVEGGDDRDVEARPATTRDTLPPAIGSSRARRRPCRARSA